MDVLIPHESPMRWIDCLVQCSETEAIAEAQFAPGHFAVEDGRVLEAALVECVAQTVAAAMAWRQQESGAPDAPRAVGMLAAVTGFQVHTRPRAGVRLSIGVRELRTFGRMLMIHGTVTVEGRCCAEGGLTVYI